MLQYQGFLRFSGVTNEPDIQNSLNMLNVQDVWVLSDNTISFPMKLVAIEPLWPLNSLSAVTLTVPIYCHVMTCRGWDMSITWQERTQFGTHVGKTAIFCVLALVFCSLTLWTVRRVGGRASSVVRWCQVTGDVSGEHSVQCCYISVTELALSYITVHLTFSLYIKY